MSERRRSAFLGIFFGYAGLAISLARNIFFVPLYLKAIPLATYGAWLATGGALALILISDYGLSGVVTQKISVDFGAQKLDQLGQLAGSALAISLLLAGALTVLSVALTPFLPGLDQISASESHTVRICFIVAIAANALGVIGGTATSVLRSLQHAQLSGWIVLAAEFGNVLVILAGLYLGDGLYAIAAGVLVRGLVLALPGCLAVWSICARQLKRRMVLHWPTVNGVLGESGRFFLSSIAIKLQAQAGVFFAGMILGPASAAVYSLTARAYDTVLSVVIMITGSLVPSVTHLLGTGNLARFKTVLLRMLVLLGALTALAMTTIVILNPTFLRLWAGGGAFGGEAVSALMAFALFASVIGGVSYDAMLAQGKFRLITQSFVLSAVLQIVILLSFLNRGLWVAPLASLVTQSAWALSFWKRVKADVSIEGREFLDLFWEFLRLFVISGAVVVAWRALYPPADSWLAFLAEGAICASSLMLLYLAASRSLRRIASEEMETTLRVFKAA